MAWCQFVNLKVHTVMYVIFTNYPSQDRIICLYLVKYNRRLVSLKKWFIVICNSKFAVWWSFNIIYLMYDMFLKNKFYYSIIQRDSFKQTVSFILYLFILLLNAKRARWSLQFLDYLYLLKEKSELFFELWEFIRIRMNSWVGFFFLLYLSHYSLCYSASPLLFRKKAMSKQTRVDISGSHRSGLLIVDIWSLSLFDGASTVTLPTPHAPDPLSHLMAITVPLRAINTP